jgi:hypothetical protein
MGDISTRSDGPSSQRAWRITRSWFFLIVASVGLSGATSESEWARKGEPMPLNLSSPGETVLATCPVGRKIASICGQRLGQAVYRFGRPRHIELVTTGLRYSSIPYAGGGETQVYFSRGGYRYILYDLMTRTGFGPDGRFNPVMTNRFILQHNGRFRILSHCPGVDPVIMSGLVRDYMPQGEFIEHEELNRLTFSRPADL